MHLVAANDIKPEEIESIHAWGEATAVEPVSSSRVIERTTDAQFSTAHGLALAAHRIPPGPAWQDASTVYNPSILKMMDKVTFEVHPDNIKFMKENPLARPTKVEIKARGKVFTDERLYPRGSRSPQPETVIATDELVAKFKINAERMISSAKIDAAVKSLLKLEEVKNFAEVMKLVSLSGG